MSLHPTNLTTNTTTPSCPDSIVFPLGITGHYCAVPLCHNTTAILQSCCHDNPVTQYTYPGINEGNKTYQGLYCFLNGTRDGNLTEGSFIDCVGEMGFQGVMGCDEGNGIEKKGDGQRVDVRWMGLVVMGLLVSGFVSL